MVCGIIFWSAPVVGREKNLRIVFFNHWPSITSPFINDMLKSSMIATFRAFSFLLISSRFCTSITLRIFWFLASQKFGLMWIPDVVMMSTLTPEIKRTYMELGFFFVFM